MEVFYHGCKRSMGTFGTQDHAALANMTARQILLDQTNSVSLSAEEVVANIEAAKKAGKLAVQQSQMSSHGNSHFGTGERWKKAKKAIAGMKKDPADLATEQPKQQTEVTLPPPVEQVMQLVADPVAPEHPKQKTAKQKTKVIIPPAEQVMSKSLSATGRLEVFTKEATSLEMWSITRKKIRDLRKELKSERDAGVIGKLEGDINILMKRKAEYAEKMGLGS